MSTDTNALIAITALNKMFEGSSFSICTIDKVAKVLGVIPPKGVYDQLSALHCVDWSAMPRELRQQVPRLVQEALSGDKVFRFQLVTEPTSALAVIDGTKHTRRPLLARVFGD